MLAAVGMVLSPGAETHAQSPDVPPGQPAATNSAVETPASESQETMGLAVHTVEELKMAVHANTNLNLDPMSPEYDEMVSFVREAQATGVLMHYSSGGETTAPEPLLEEETLHLQKNVIVIVDGDCFENAPFSQQSKAVRDLVLSGELTIVDTTYVRAGDELLSFLRYINVADESSFEDLRSKRPTEFKEFREIHSAIFLSRIAKKVDYTQTSVICAVAPNITQLAPLVRQLGNQNGGQTTLITRSVALSSEQARAFSDEMQAMAAERSNALPKDIIVFNSAGNSGLINNEDYGEIVGVGGLEQPTMPQEAAFLPLSNKMNLVFEGQDTSYTFAALGTGVTEMANGALKIGTGTSAASPELASQVLEIKQSLTPQQELTYDEFRQTNPSSNERVRYLLTNYGGLETLDWVLTSGAISGNYELDSAWAQHLLAVFNPTEVPLVSAQLIISGDQISSRDYGMWPMEDSPEVIAPELQLPRALETEVSLQQVQNAILSVVLQFSLADGSVVEKDVSRGMAGLRMQEELKRYGKDLAVKLKAEDVRYEKIKIIWKDSTFNKTFFPVVENAAAHK